MIYHILNGDCLKEQFPKDIVGEKIIARECLVDGNVEGESSSDLFNTRAKFISEAYDGYDESDYFIKVVPEFEKIKSIPNHSEINLWFEDDLFCQVNLWFVIHLLNELGITTSINLVRPTIDVQFGFGGMSSSALIEAFLHKKQIDEPTLQVLHKLWRLYQCKEHQEMLKLAELIKEEYGFVKTAIEAEMDRFPNNGNEGRPHQTLKNIMTELQTEDFGTVFKEFNRRERIYGFGDLQVKRLFDEVKNNH